MAQSRMSRRSFLQFSAASGALVALAACAAPVPDAQAPAAESGAENCSLCVGTQAPPVSQLACCL